MYIGQKKKDLQDNSQEYICLYEQNLKHKYVMGFYC